tara:strand:+ start:4467 stop:5069 length:603 start_codon:yes stop_codon:yes gene_type:complete
MSSEQPNRFFYWGPLLFKTKVDKYKDMLKKIKKEYNYNKHLASHIDETYSYNIKEFKKNVGKQFNSYFNFYEHYYNTTLPSKDYIVEYCWVNIMKAGDSNPPHTHDGDFSCVLYLQIPDSLKKEGDNYVGRDTAGPGGIKFIYGEDRPNCITDVEAKPVEGDMYIFPANLRHVVNSFKSNGTRISMAANIKLKHPVKYCS